MPRWWRSKPAADDPSRQASPSPSPSPSTGTGTGTGTGAPSDVAPSDVAPSSAARSGEVATAADVATAVLVPYDDAATVVVHDDVADPSRWEAYRPTSMLDGFVDKAVTIPSSTIRKHVAAVRRRNPEASPARVIQLLEREYLRVVGTAGGAVGAAAAIPAVGTGTGVALTTADVATFFTASAAFSLAVAEVHGIRSDDVARRRALLLASVLGAKGARDVESAIGGSTTAWGKVLLTTMPQGSVRRVNKALASTFLKRQLAKHGTLALGRLVPFGVGAVVGLAGGRALGHGVVAQSRRAFGPPPPHFPPAP